ncbi:MAG: hypothetical protein M0R17_00130 [Candidatus Omnitrophica bacterium]|jgi:hypothetical protein|nr:hypothetical protein [Candidatus Omnitrophota bacterium]
MSFDITLITCSYDTPKVTLTMLKSWKHINYNITNKLLLIDNSTNEDTAELLHESNIPFYRNPNSLHYQGVELGLKLCRTKYAILVDTDVIFKNNITKEIQYFIDNDITLAGEEIGDSCGWLMHPRIHPYFSFINVENIKNNKIMYTNINKVISTESQGFYTMKSDVPKGKVRRYDVGATFYEDISSCNLKIFNIKMNPRYLSHYLAMSWQSNSNTISNYTKDTANIANLSIKDWYING